MKRVLLATTALGMSAGVAFAQDMGMADDGMMMEPATSVTLSGDGRMGVISTMDEELKFSSRIRIKVTAAATLDNGLSAGGSVRTDQDGTGGKAGNIFLSGPFGTLSMGDVDAGAKAAVGQVASVGYVNQGDPNEISYLRGGGGDDPTLQYKLPKLGPVQVYASVGMETTKVQENGQDKPTGTFTNEFTDDAELGVTTDDDGNITITGAESTADVEKQTEISADTLSIGARADLAIGDMGTAWIGGGFEASTEATHDGHIVFGAGVSASGFSGTVVAGMQGRDATENADGSRKDNDVEQFAVSAGYSAGPMGVTVFYTDDSDMEKGAEALGAGFEWSLGGGASLKAGFTSWPGQTPTAEDKQTADLGVTFAF